MARTVDDIGIDVSRKWAEEQQKTQEQKTFTEGARGIPQQTTQLVQEPIFPPELAELLGLGQTNVPIAKFLPPPHYETPERPCFVNGLTLWSTKEKLDASKERVSLSMLPAAITEKSAAQREQTLLTQCLTQCEEINKNIIAIYSFREQYHRG